MRGSRNFCKGGGFLAQLPENSSDNVFFIFLVLNLFYSFALVYQLFISKKAIISQCFRGGPAFSWGGGGGGGVATFFRGVKLFPGGSKCKFA